MEAKTNRMSVWSVICNLLLAAAVGSLISLPFWLAYIAHQLDDLQTAYFAVEACRAGADLEVCGALRGEK